MAHAHYEYGSQRLTVRLSPFFSSAQEAVCTCGRNTGQRIVNSLSDLFHVMLL